MIYNQKTLKTFRNISDIVVISLSFLLAAVFAQSYAILLGKEHMFILLFLMIGLWYVSTDYSIKNSKEYSSFIERFANLIKKSFIQVLLAIAFIFITKENLFTRNFVLYYFILILAGSTVKEYLIFSYFKNKKPLKCLSIFYKNEDGLKISRFIINKPEYGYAFAGFFTDYNINYDNYNEVENIINEKGITDILLNLNTGNEEKIKKILLICDRLAVNAHIVPGFYNLLSSRYQFNFLGDYPIVTVRTNPLEELQNRMLKRFFDISFSAIVTVLILSWLIPLVAVFIKATSKGPVFFVQDRFGKDDRLFKCFKFRTMYTDIRNKGFNPVTDDDKRITRIGRILRKTNLDEVPQFINVLLGNMSIVGPRPHAVNYNNTYSEFVEEIKLRHRVKSGITGWAQIHGYRGDVFDFEENKKRTKSRIEFDIWYIENWTFSLDIKIILYTVLQIISGRNLGK
ncbi:MAG: exopolysaccharide biosynthesis polyprenyl glycosylphosphotransferase [Ignavibacteria bacterium]|jgi:putative colanic acid biosynthesis UDP-glucose lipid carrier transferase